MSHTLVAVDDLSVVLGWVDRYTRAPADVVAARNRLGEALTPSLFGPPLSDPGAVLSDPASHHGRETEKAAAYANRPRAGSQRLRVLEAIARAGVQGRTDEELEDRLEMRRPSPGNRRGELVAGGWVRDSGQRRKTKSGSSAVVWVLTDAGRARLAQHQEASA